MTATDQATDLTQKTRDLCQAIVDLPNFSELKQRIDAFMADELVKFQFQMVSDRGSLLQMKQNSAAMINDEEIAEFNKLRDELMANPIAKNFLEAQNEVARIQESVNKYLSKTFELGRTPTAEDLDDGSCCSSGCGCH
ncbi:MAG TPA: YlbF family regulator [Verrucomicrobiae bacterium]|jgi:cell fate (sporulation/competence/biofilm development) regulator YlbF (YheA/YmcA/DUF963 family)